MSALPFIAFIIGSGLILLGAYFLWRVTAWQGGMLIVPTGIPAGVMISLATVNGLTEVAIGVLWGTVVFNLGMIGVVGLFFRIRQKRTTGLMALLWLAFGLVACLVAGNGVGLGRFSGLALLTIGMIAFGQKHQTQVDTKLGWRAWMSLVVAVIFCSLGAWLIVRNHAVVSTFMSLPVSIFSLLIIAPICTFGACFGLRVRKQWQAEQVLSGLTQSNMLLPTFGLGLVAVWIGGVHCSQSLLTITLPWTIVIAVLVAIGNFLPQKTARWWGGLVVLMILGLMLSLLG